jgi:hypothetical protein
VAWREDTDIFFTLLEMGERAGVPSWSPGAAAMYPHVPEAIVVHPVRPAPWGISLRQQRRNLYNALLFKKHPSLYRQRIQVAPPWLYYASLAALLGGGTGMLAGQPRAGVAGLVLWAALTGRFCARRLRGTSHAPRHVAEMVVTSALIPPVAVFWRLAGAVKYGVRFL